MAMSIIVKCGDCGYPVDCSLQEVKSGELIIGLNEDHVCRTEYDDEMILNPFEKAVRDLTNTVMWSSGKDCMPCTVSIQNKIPGELAIIITAHGSIDFSLLIYGTDHRFEKKVQEVDNALTFVDRANPNGLVSRFKALMVAWERLDSLTKVDRDQEEMEICPEVFED